LSKGSQLEFSYLEKPSGDLTKHWKTSVFSKEGRGFLRVSLSQLRLVRPERLAIFPFLALELRHLLL
jgi:hypothetical protein